MSIEDALTAYRGDLVAATRRWQVARERRRRRLLLTTGVLGLACVIVGTAVAAGGWLIGAPAPRSVKSDFGSYASQLGFNPQPGKAVLVASSGKYQLYATTNKQGGYCILVSAPWKRPGPHGEGGDCSPRSLVRRPFWAGIGGLAGAQNERQGTTLVLDGRTRDARAASVHFTAPNQKPVSARVGSSGFFIVGFSTRASWCQITHWRSRFTVLDAHGHKLSTTTRRVIEGGVCFTKPTPTVSTQHGQPTITIHVNEQGYLPGAKQGDRIACRAGSTTITTVVLAAGRRAFTRHTLSPNRRLALTVQHLHTGRVFVYCDWD